MAGDAKRVLLLYSDTGGGHRSPARAVAHALLALYGERVRVEMVDAFADYAPWPLNRAAAIYRHLVGWRGWPWALAYHLSDGPRRAAWLVRCFWPWVATHLRRLFRDHPADAVISCHPGLNHASGWALADAGLDIPLITLVVDLATAHALWSAPEARRVLVPTERARRRALACGVLDERIAVAGLPVRGCFRQAAGEDTGAVRRRLGLGTERPVVLVMNGGEGMGSCYHTCVGLAESDVRAQIVVIAGRNERLRSRLAAKAWPLPMRVEGFVDNVHEWMKAADLLVSKAGPSTIAEASLLGLPMVLSGALLGQERPNVEYVVRAGAGLWAPTPQQTVEAVRRLVGGDGARLERMARRARALARPDAAERVARVVGAAIGVDDNRVDGLSASSGDWPRSQVVLQSRRDG